MSVRIVKENRGAEGFGEDVRKIVYARDKVHLNIPPENFFTNKIIVNLYVFGIGMENKITGKSYGRDIITPQFRKIRKNKMKLTEQVV